jgi:hypothetical protein
MAVPNTTTFSLQDVVNEVNPTTDDLEDCFADSIPAYFDPNYSGNTDSLYNFRNYNATPPPTCPNQRIVIQICNSNSSKDDNFDIYLNSFYIGAVDLNQNAQIGSIFIGDTNTGTTVVSSDFACPLSGMVTYHFNANYVASSNTIEMINTQENGNNNAGSIGVRAYILSGNDLEYPCVIDDMPFFPNDGEDFTTYFTYSACCDTIVGVSMSTVGKTSALLACDEVTTTTRYISGSNTTPDNGEIVYTDSGGTTLFDGSNKWHYVGNIVFIVSSVGVISSVGFCTPPS